MFLRVVLVLVAAAATPSSADISGQTPPAGSCICLKTNGVNIRSSACGSVIGSGNTGMCFKTRGTKTQCVLSGTTYQFFNFDYAGAEGWSAGDFFNMGSEDDCNSGGPGDCNGVKIVTRSEWGARPPTGRTFLNLPLSKAFVHHSAGASCTTQASCMSTVKGIQDWHMDGNNWADIGYNFLVGEDGNAYEGRGWDVQGAHAGTWNPQSHGICVMGDFTSSRPNAAALAAVDNLISCGIQQGKLTNNYLIHGHRDGVCTSCPGDALYSWVMSKGNFGGKLSGGCHFG
jgi:N-acetylmuramoyl-L-alanine amidase